ncbi:hypothetical protein MVEN_00123500 [Mycena venus]|uniref:Uncharacterized protein n=1 Tax=Mycena venus TaxID=2733690 RepID=A0A8H6ZA89_9AGAR|nr:hypothetical protein MVEN_00123500 [Mycena venus]
MPKIFRENNLVSGLFSRWRVIHLVLLDSPQPGQTPLWRIYIELQMDPTAAVLTMPTHSSNISHTVLQFTVIAADALRDLGKAAQIPFVGTVCSLTLAVVPLIQNTKSQKEKCLQMVEDIHLVLCALMGLCIDSDNLASPQLLEHIAEYAQTLKKFHACLKAQKELGNLKRLFKQGEITQQLSACKQELSNACDVFRVGLLNNFDSKANMLQR